MEMIRKPCTYSSTPETDIISTPALVKLKRRDTDAEMVCCRISAMRQLQRATSPTEQVCFSLHHNVRNSWDSGSDRSCLSSYAGQPNDGSQSLKLNDRGRQKERAKRCFVPDEVVDRISGRMSYREWEPTDDAGLGTAQDAEPSLFSVSRPFHGMSQTRLCFHGRIHDLRTAYGRYTIHPIPKVKLSRPRSLLSTVYDALQNLKLFLIHTPLCLRFRAVLF